MNGFLFFTGSFLRWLVKEPRQSLLLLGYFASLHGLATLLEFQSSSGRGFLFTVAMLGPLGLRIYQGLPIDCLSYKAEINREEMARKLV